MKRIIGLISLVLLFSFAGTLGVFAAPDTVAADEQGNTYDLIVITNPQNQKDSTFDSAYIVSGHGKEGTTVTLYWHDATENVYKKVYNETQYVDAEGVSSTVYSEATVTIGASGLFMNTVILAPGGNNLLVRAENGDMVQMMEMSITKYNYNLFDIIKSLTKQ